jgi:hypothetical protein
LILVHGDQVPASFLREMMILGAVG